MKVYLAQLKCPTDHCVMAVFGVFETEEEALRTLKPALSKQFHEMVDSKVLKYECGICYSTTLHIQVGRTIFETMEEATPVLILEQGMQQLTSTLLKRHKDN